MARLSVYLAVLAVLAASVAATGTGDVSVTADISKGAVATDAAHAATATAAATGSIAMPTKQMPTITMPTIQMPTIEMPTVKKEDAGCVNKCSNECTVSLKQTCTMVPVTNKECATVTKTTTTKKCHKKCCVDIPVPAPATAPAAANPSAPAAAAAAPATAAADISFSMPSLHGKGRKLAAAQGVPFIKALFGGKQSSQPAATCGEVMCVDVPSTSSEIECKDVTKEVQQCSTAPVKDCKEVCKCVPMQKVTVTLPGHSFGHMG